MWQATKTVGRWEFWFLRPPRDLRSYQYQPILKSYERWPPTRSYSHLSPPHKIVFDLRMRESQRYKGPNIWALASCYHQFPTRCLGAFVYEKLHEICLGRWCTRLLSNDPESPEEPTTSRWRSSRFQVTSHMAWLLSQDMWLEEIAVLASLRALDLELALCNFSLFAIF